jgi:N-acetylglucosaminyldiphosphoundecaprenol N-acetyl-beta-D-mannosaminyltransferase
MINEAKPDILFVGLGAGRQERWLKNNLARLNVKIGMAIGGSLDVLSGRKNRAPKWVQSLYIEWLYRLLTEPQRWRRQLALPKFLWLMFKPTNFPKIN